MIKPKIKQPVIEESSPVLSLNEKVLHSQDKEIDASMRLENNVEHH